MNGFNKKIEFVVYVGILVISIALIFGSFYIDHHDFSSLAKELGFAGIIAVLVIFSVERFAKEKQTEFVEELIHRINTSMFLAMYNKKLPKLIFDEIEKIILAARTYRKDNEISYELASIDELPFNLLVTYKTEYTLFTTSEKREWTLIKVCLEKPIDKVLLPYCHIDKVVFGSLTLSKNDITRCTTETESYLEFEHPVELHPDVGIHVTIISSLVKLKTDVEVWTSLMPTESLILKITAKQPLQNLAVKADALHPHSFTKTVEDKSSGEWRLHHPILPHQGYVMWWDVS
jgi:hypothetical protein